MLRYQDFIPRMHKAPSVGVFGDISLGSFESFDFAVQAAGAWIRDHRIQVINLETVVLTSVGTSSQPVGVAVPPAGGTGTLWHQFVRVWYDDEGERPPYR
jgi:hypothetical protein